MITGTADVYILGEYLRNKSYNTTGVYATILPTSYETHNDPKAR